MGKLRVVGLDALQSKPKTVVRCVFIEECFFKKNSSGEGMISRSGMMRGLSKGEVPYTG